MAHLIELSSSYLPLARRARIGIFGWLTTATLLVASACSAGQGDEPAESQDNADKDSALTPSDSSDPSEDSDNGTDDPTSATEDGENNDPETEDPGEQSEVSPHHKFDVGAMPDWEPEDERGCEKVDFLFVIDNSASMEDEQKNLIASFPGFIESIETTLMTQDFHIMAVDSDRARLPGKSSCTGTECTCDPAPGCCHNLCQLGQATLCNDQTCDELPPENCEDGLGSGRIESGTGMNCGIEGEQRYITNKQDDVSEAFTCTGNVGIKGDGREMVIQTMRTALSEQLNGADGCNSGFLRDDAILVVTFISDEEEDGTKSPGDPQEWYDSLVAAKNGNPEAVVTIGMIGDLDTPNPICTEFDGAGTTGAQPSPRLREFISLFGKRGMAASVCAENYEPYFTEAVSIIEDACDQFIPK